MTDWSTEGGGHQAIYRGTAYGTTTIGSNYALSGAVDIKHFNSLSFVVMGSAWTGGTMAFKAAHASTEGTWWPVCSTTGSLARVTGITFGSMYAAPDAAAAQHYVKFWAEDGSGGTEAQTGDRTIRYYLKG